MATKSNSHIFIHTTWATKFRQHLIFPKLESQIHFIIQKEFIYSGCAVFAINGMPDHIHVLFRLNKKKSLMEVLKKAKGASSYYINQGGLCPFHFQWQRGYAAFSIREEQIEHVSHYIAKQKQHHVNRNYSEELKLLKKLGRGFL